MSRAVVMDVCTILSTPVYRPLMLIWMARRVGVEVICRSYLGRSTTKRLMAKVGLLPVIDDFIWNDKPIPDEAYEVFGPDDELLHLVGHELTARLNYAGRVPSFDQTPQESPYEVQRS